MDDSLKKLVDDYENAAQATQEERARSERDRDYYDHKQLTSEQLAELARRKQSPVIINYIQKKINFLLGVERQTRQDPKAYPRTPAHEDAAHAASDAIRYVTESQNFDAVSSDCYEDMLVEGIGAAIVEVVPKSLDEYEIEITRIPWDRHFRDPHSREKDFSDATYEGFIKWMDQAEAEALAKKYGSELEAADDESGMFGETDSDRPAYKTWSDSIRKRVKICYIWKLEKGVWRHSIFTKSGLIWEGDSPYLDEDEKPCNPIESQSPMVDRENARYGYARLMISQQDAINKRESKSLHLLSQRQTWSKQGIFENVAAAKQEFAKPDGHLEITHGEMGKDFGVFDTGDMAQGQFLLLQEAKRDLADLAQTGSVNNESVQSGRALEARSQSGQIELTPFTDSHKQWKKRIYRQIWNRIRQFWKSERWVRVTDDENNLKWVGLNTPITQAEQMIMDQSGLSQIEIQQQYGAELQAIIQQNPMLGQPIKVDNQVAELDVDIIIDETPDIINIQAEQFDIIANVASQRGDIPTALLIKMSSMRNKEQVLDELEGDDQQKAMAAQQQAQAQEVQVRQLLAEIGKTEAETMKLQTEAQKTQVETQLALTYPDPNLQVTI